MAIAITWVLISINYGSFNTFNISAGWSLAIVLQMIAVVLRLNYDY